MSWGYFLEFELTVSTDDWATLEKVTGAGLSAQWWGFEDADLEHTFGNAGFENATFKKIWGYWTHGQSCMKAVVEAGGKTSVHLVAHLDKGGDTQVAGVVAAMFEEAAKLGGTGRIRLVNDGSYSGEDGVEVAIVDGRLVRSKVEGSNEIAEELGMAVYPGMAEEIEQYLSPQAKAREAATAKRKKPATKTKKPASKKAAAKKPASKKTPAAKKPATKMSATKKSATKNTRNKRAAKKPLTKKSARTAR